MRVKCRLFGADGNAFAVMGRVAQALKEAGKSKEDVDSYVKRATSGDYQALINESIKTLEDAGIEYE